MADCEATPGLSFDLQTCVCVLVCMHYMCVYVCACICLYVCDNCV